MKVSLDSIITSSELSWKGSIRQLSSSKTFCQTAWNSFLLPASSSTGPSFLLASLYLFPFFPEWGQSFATSGYNALQNTLRVESGLVVINYQPSTESDESRIWTGHSNLPLNELRIVFELVVINSHESNAKLKPDHSHLVADESLFTLSSAIHRLDTIMHFKVFLYEINQLMATRPF